jgi:hypothetical protein
VEKTALIVEVGEADDASVSVDTRMLVGKGVFVLARDGGEFVTRVGTLCVWTG